YRTDKSSSADVDVMEGDIFAGTFGRGTFQTTTLMNTRPVSIAENEDIEKPSTALRLFPNPAEEKTTIETYLSEGTYQIEVVDLNGRTVLSQKCEARESGMNQFTINISELSNGMYIIGIQGKADSYARLMVAR
ncbi:MAG: T9SS type A sorting domain-containing protein, partial [Schleiferiaceae bacterium]